MIFAVSPSQILAAGEPIKQGRMMSAGLKKIEEAKRSGSWHKLDNVDGLRTIPPDLVKALGADKVAQKNFRKMSPTSQKQFLWWIESAKREETRKNRIAKSVGLISQNKTMSDYFYSR